MIERHYFKDKLIRSYDFAFGFCIPGSTNSWEAIYPMPELTEDERKYTLGGGGDGGALADLPMCRAALRRRACGCGCRCGCGAEIDIINNPYCTRSDSFYFVDDKLIMHNKAEYAYTEYS